jgi:protein-S-isoprenylcysteine O-methyltransferase Ste14
VLHSVLADNNVKQFIKAKIGSLFVLYRLFYNLIAIFIMGLIVFALKDLSNHKVLFDVVIWLKYFSVLLITAGVTILSVAIYNYNLLDFSGINQLLGKEEKNDQLITTGLNSIVRHPIYFALILMLSGIVLFVPTDLVLASVLYCLAYLYIGTKLEERKLLQIFGDSYKQYQQKVKMFIPYML